MEITLGKIVSYIGGTLLVLFGVISLLISPIGGLLLFVTGLFALPIVRGKLVNLTGVSFSRWAVFGIVFVGVIFGMGGIATTVPSDSTDNPNQNIQAKDNPGGTQEAQMTQAAKVHSVHETFSVGSGNREVQYTVTNISTATNIGGQYGENADGVFVIVEIEMKNTGKESFEVSGNLFKLVDSQEREYDTDTDAMIYAENSVVYEQVDPGVTKKGVLIFDVPKDQSGRQLKINPVGIFSTADAHYVQLK